MSKDPFDWTGAVLLAVGAVVFLWGGAQHPSTDASMGVIGTPEYFRAFAEHVAASENWSVFHTGILAGPLLWALGIVAFTRRASAGKGGPWSQLGVHALGLGALAWSVVFVLDGFVAPMHAAAVLGTGTVDAMVAFQTNQEVVIRLGLVSWILIGVGVASASVGASMSSAPGLRRLVFGAFGVTVGLWPLAAWLTGEFVPGPFTSRLWTATALITSLWVAWAAVELVGNAPQVQEAGS